MPHPKPLPKYRLHKAKGLGVVTLNGRHIYLGAYGTPASLEQYHRVVGEWVANGRRLVDRSEQLTVIEVMAAFIEHARTYYRRPDGTATSEFDNFCQALRPLKKLYGTTSACEFGPTGLRTVQRDMITLGWCRGNINKQINRIRSFFKWAAGRELIPAAVYQALQCVPPLKRGRSDAAESAPVRPVPQTYIDAVNAYVSRQVWAVIELQLMTGARAGELLVMRPVDIDMSGDTWAFAPVQHKTAHHGHSRVIYLGPRAQAVIRPFLAGRPVDAFIFSPAEAERERLEKLHAQRKTPPSRGNGVGTNRVTRPARQPGSRYDVAAYRRAIARGCEKADRNAHRENPGVAADEILIPRWHPHQLRHNAATELRKHFGIECARVVLGHRSAFVTEIYAEQDRGKAQLAMGKIG